MENQNKIILAIGAIAAAYFGKKHLDKRRGSSAIWNLQQGQMSQFDAFAAFSQRKAGLIPWENEADQSLNRLQFMKKYSADGYDSTRFGPTSENQTIWNQWLSENTENYGDIEKIMGSTIEGRFDGATGSSDGALSGAGTLKHNPMSPQPAFDGTTSSSASVMSGEGNLKYDTMPPQGKYSGGKGRDYDPFSPFRVPKF